MVKPYNTNFLGYRFWFRTQDGEEFAAMRAGFVDSKRFRIVAAKYADKPPLPELLGSGSAVEIFLYARRDAPVDQPSAIWRLEYEGSEYFPLFLNAYSSDFACEAIDLLEARLHESWPQSQEELDKLAAISAKECA